MGVHWSSEANTSIRLYDLGELYKHKEADKKIKALDRLAVRSTTAISRTTPQASIELMIDLIPMGLSAYLRIKSQLNTLCVILGEIAKRI